MKVRKRIKAQETRQWYDDVLLVVTDPFGSLNRVVDGLLGIREEKTRCSRLFPGHSGPQKGQEGIYEEIAGTHYRAGSTIGLQMRFDW